jgi:hypothetical protein
MLSIGIAHIFQKKRLCTSRLHSRVQTPEYSCGKSKNGNVSCCDPARICKVPIRDCAAILKSWRKIGFTSVFKATYHVDLQWPIVCWPWNNQNIGHSALSIEQKAGKVMRKEWKDMSIIVWLCFALSKFQKKGDLLQKFINPNHLYIYNFVVLDSCGGESSRMRTWWITAEFSGLIDAHIFSTENGNRCYLLTLSCSNWHRITQIYDTTCTIAQNPFSLGLRVCGVVLCSIRKEKKYLSLSEKPECRCNGTWLQRLNACRYIGRLF